MAEAASSNSLKETKSIGINETIALALENSPELKASRARASIAALASSNAWSSFLPQLGIKATHGLTGQSSKASPNTTITAEATATIYDNGVTYTRYHASLAEQEIADLNFLRERDRLILAVTQAYFRYSLSVSLQMVQKQQFEIITKQFQRVVGQYRQGIRTRRDYMRLKSEAHRAQIELQSAQNNAELARLELLRMASPDPSASIPLTFKPLQMDDDRLLKSAAPTPSATTSYEYRLAVLRSKLMDHDVKLATRSAYPELGVRAEATHYLLKKPEASLLDPQGTDDRSHWTIQGSISYNLIDWGIRRRNISIAETKRSAAEQEAQTELIQLRMEQSKAALEWNEANQRLKMARELLKMEESSYEELAAEYRNGKISYSDLILGLRDMLNAKVQVYNTWHAVQEQLTKLRYWEGTIHDFRF
jgi:outer membrane protein TolC